MSIEIEAALIGPGVLEELAIHLFGEPNNPHGNWRWGSKGGRSLTRHGPWRGRFSDWETDYHGGPLAMIVHWLDGSKEDPVTWARTFLGGGSLPAPDAETLRRRTAARHEAEEEEKADRKLRIFGAQWMWNRSGRINSTAAEFYLVAARKIPRCDDWPDAIRCYPPDEYERQLSSLIMALTTDDGTVTAVQRIHLDRYGNKRSWLPKQSFGVRDDAVVRLPGDPSGPLAIAEGPETGLSVWAATGYATWITCGTITRITPPTGRQVIACRDDDPRNAPANVNLNKGLARWAKQGVNFYEAWPWPERRYDKSDFNDVLMAGGVAAVKKALSSPDPPPAVERFTADEARDEMTRVIREFFARVEARSPDDPPLARAIRVELGAGKSSKAREAITPFIRQLRANGDKRSVVIAVPTHRLGAEAAREFPADIRVGIWRGRGAADPDRPSETMCRDLEAVSEARAVLAPVEETCCRRPARNDAPEARCQFYDTCAYQRQKRVKAEVWFTAHETLFTRKPKVVGEVAAIVVDENPFAAGIRTGVSLPVGALSSVTPVFDKGVEYVPFTDILVTLRKKLLRAFDAMPDGAVTRAGLKAAGVTGDDTSGGFQLEWLRKQELGLRPGMTPQERTAALEAVKGNRTIGKFAMLWQALRALTDAGGPEASGWIELAHDGGDGERIIWLRGRKEPAAGFAGVPTLLMDANLRIELLKPFWPAVELAADLAVAAPYQHVRQVIDENYGKTKLTEQTKRGEKQRRDLRAVVARFARRYWPAKVLVVAQLAVEKTLTELGSNAMTAHHNAVAGLDRWRDVRALMVIGRTAPGPLDVERAAMALTGHAVASVGKAAWYPQVIVARETRGDNLTAVADRHPDPIAEAIRWQICEGEVMQIIGRARGVNRTMMRPLDVWVLTNVVLPLPVDKTLRAQGLAPSPADQMLAAGGIVFLSPRDASRAYSALWETPKAAKHARQGNYPQTRIHSSYTGLGPVSAWSYRQAGARGPAATALVDETLHPDPAAALAAKLGRLTMVTQVAPRRASPVERARCPGEALNAVLGSALFGRDRRTASLT